MLFRIWQNALMDQPMSTQEMWTWVHQCYGDELGLTSDDDDYVAPPVTADGERNHNNNKKDSTSDILEHLTNESEKNVDKNSNPHISRDSSSGTNESVDTVIPNAGGHSASDQPQSDVSDSSGSESESEKNDKPLGAIKCPAAHEGRLMLHMQVAIHVDQLFSHLFTNSKFLLDLHEIRKSTDIKQSAWTVNPSTNQKGRTVSLTVTLGQAIGPKHAQVTESQKMLPCSTPGEIYSIEIEASNAGVPYSDTFYVISHYCLTRGSDPNTSTIAVYCQIKYRKSVWGIVKSYIEKHCWQGIEDYFNDLVKALETECERTRRTMTSLPGTKRKGIRRRRSGVSKMQALPMPDIEEKPLVQPLVLPTQTAAHLPQNADTLAWIVFLTLFLLLVLNAALYYKLWGLEQSERRLSDPTSDLDMDNFRFAPRTPEEWRTLLQKQEQLHAFEVERWLRILKASVHLLQQVENSLTGLQESIQGAMADVNDASSSSDSLTTDHSDL
uniref:GRAM domain-containing protein 1B n=1 Tax=Lygus hesperus TaxID=30085 RepID=A0A0A9Y0V3_LYGHE